MAIYTALSLLVMVLIPSAIAKDTPMTNQTINNAIGEMQRANYFAFVMLLNMVSTDKIPSNITFLMPNNRLLAKAVIPENDVLDFLLRHSIPTPLRFDYLKRFPTGSVIPSSDPGFMLKVFNNGRKSFFLNNVKLISPDICVAGSSVRCHGIDGVLTLQDTSIPPSLPVPTNTSSSPPSPMAPPPSLPPTAFAPAATPQPAGPHKSGSYRLGSEWSLIGYMSNWVLLSIVWCYL
ncbi:FAS1 domain-containing protein SELMODRAFT_448915 [Beta vulgaris subsp. vulgaris]|uniref:FAS1 domain-containing protein SELMODRAFT_448915 n=1 Tax=Beta vulgaris subsp. vulgaris TaxID=3555 RepID=UPI00203730C5|nr:FAS1 domain-containing protein SELMODRAFT_448915 [Beta vulgaris subsp. vulgaris]